MRNKIIVGTAAVAMAVIGVGTAGAVTYQADGPGPMAAGVASAAPTTTTVPPTTAAPTDGSTMAASSAPSTTVAPTTPPVTAAPVTPAAPVTAAPAPVTAAASAQTVVYVVKAGDNLSAIAWWFEIHGYQSIYQANQAVIGANPNLIYPGEKITISGGKLATS